MYGNVYDANHIYYADFEKNTVKPTWFIHCTRKEAETILKRNKEYGNVLIRPNSQFDVNGHYALSAMTEKNGFAHFVISRGRNGFLLEVKSKPPSMASLEQVLNHYISVAGSEKHHAIVIDPTTIDDGVYLNPNKISRRRISDSPKSFKTIGDSCRDSQEKKNGQESRNSSIYIEMDRRKGQVKPILNRSTSLPETGRSRHSYVNVPRVLEILPDNDDDDDDDSSSGDDYENSSNATAKKVRPYYVNIKEETEKQTRGSKHGCRCSRDYVNIQEKENDRDEEDDFPEQVAPYISTNETISQRLSSMTLFPDYVMESTDKKSTNRKSSLQ